MPMKQYVVNTNGNCRLCQNSDADLDQMIDCSECDRLFHITCVKLTRKPKPEEYWLCPKCQQIAYEMNRLNDLSKQSPKGDDKKEASGLESVIERLVLSQQQQIKEQANEFSKLVTMLTESNLESKAETQKKDEKITTFIKRQTLTPLPKFGGLAKEWPIFINMFHRTTAEGSFDNSENLTRLNQALYGDALKVVQQLLVAPENVPYVMERLAENFGKPDIIYSEMIQSLQKLRKDSKKIVTEMSTALENIVENVHLTGNSEFLDDRRLVADLTLKLPMHLQRKRAKYVTRTGKTKQVYTLTDLNEWLKPESDYEKTLNNFHDQGQKGNVNLHTSTTSKDTQEKQAKKASKTQEHNSTNSKTLSCLICKKTHFTNRCYTLSRSNPAKRAEIASEHKLCLGCLSSNSHSIDNCPRAKQCDVDGCKSKHHRMLHPREKQTRENPVLNHHENIVSSTVHYQVLPVKLINGDKTVDTFAFLDPGSSVTLLDANVAKKLQLEGPEIPLHLTWTQNKNSSNNNSQQVQLSVKGATKQGYRLKDVRTVHKLNLPVQSFNYEEMASKYPYLKNLPIKSFDNARPTLMVGLNHNHLLMGSEHKVGKLGEPIAMKTKLGWLIYGKLPNDNGLNYAMIIQQEDELQKQLSRYFSIEDFGVKPITNLPESDEDKRAKAPFKRNVEIQGWTLRSRFAMEKRKSCNSAQLR